MDGYILVIAEGGLITSATYYDEPTPPIALAETIWKKFHPDVDDVKFFDMESQVVWQPPREDEVLDELQ